MLGRAYIADCCCVAQVGPHIAFLDCRFGEEKLKHRRFVSTILGGLVGGRLLIRVPSNNGFKTRDFFVDSKIRSFR